MEFRICYHPDVPEKFFALSPHCIRDPTNTLLGKIEIEDSLLADILARTKKRDDDPILEFAIDYRDKQDLPYISIKKRFEIKHNSY